MRTMNAGALKRKDRQPFFRRLALDFKRHKFVYFLLLPCILYLILFQIVPLYFLQVAFKDYNVFRGLEASPWVGWSNFIEIFRTKYFMESLWNTLYLSFLNIVIGFPVPIILALLLNELRFQKFQKGIQTFLYLPHFLSWVIVGSIFTTLLSPSGGLVNEIIQFFGGEPIFFMASSQHFRGVLVLTNIWKNAGWSTIIYLAAITGIDPTMYEAAVLDGANRFQRLIRLTLPMLLPTIMVVFILKTGKVLNIFDQVFAMYNPMVAGVSETVDTYVYQLGMKQGEIALSTAVGLFKNVVSVSLLLLTNKLSKMIQGTSIV